jgi:hypothetical protein
MTRAYPMLLASPVERSPEAMRKKTTLPTRER